MKPFSVYVENAVLADLRRRLAAMRWPDEPPGAGWEQGAPPAHVRGLVAHWLDGFDWRAVEATLNGFAQYTAPVAGSTSTSSRRDRPPLHRGGRKRPAGARAARLRGVGRTRACTPTTCWPGDEHARGGHFPALERTDVLADSVRRFAAAIS